MHKGQKAWTDIGRHEGCSYWHECHIDIFVAYTLQWFLPLFVNVNIYNFTLDTGRYPLNPCQIQDLPLIFVKGPRSALEITTGPGDWYQQSLELPIWMFAHVWNIYCHISTFLSFKCHVNCSKRTHYVWTYSTALPEKIHLHWAKMINCTLG